MATGYKARIIMNCGIKPISPIQFGKHECPSSYSFGPFTRDFWLLHFVVSGKGIFTNPKGTHEVKENDIFVIRPYEITQYEADADDPWTYIWIGFSSEMPLPLPLIMNDVLYAPYLREHFVSAFDNSIYDRSAGNGAFEYYICGTVWQILGLLSIGAPKLANNAEEYISAAKNIVKYEYHTNITVGDIAKRLHIARTYFSEIFKAKTGMSPKKYIEETRMQKAADLLIHHMLSVSATATSVGYPDVFAFSRAFKRYHKHSPTEYIHKFRTQGRKP